ncbi:MAG: hypothetical protein JO187_11235 [Acidobacteria bacterium]|nr:hypothetical protein [Acidobacteriaceae bacterium]MBV9610121.1 hypothetical protein [Acidobacteriota bacterium]
MHSRSRRLNVGGLLDGVPTWGTCDKCGAFFSVGPATGATAELAREKLLSDFDAHECKPQATGPKNVGRAAKGEKS